MTYNPQRVVGYDGNRSIGEPGDRADQIHNTKEVALLPEGRTYDVFTIAVSGTTATTVTLTCADEDNPDIVYGTLTIPLSGGSAALREAEIVDAIDADYLFSGLFDAVASTDAQLTSKLPANLTLTAEGDAAEFTVAHPTDAATGVKTRFGYPVFKQASGRYAGTEPSFTARLLTITPTAVNDFVYTATLSVSGVDYPLEVTADGSATATEICDDFRSAIDALALPGITSGGTATLTITGDDGFTDFQFTPTSANLASVVTAAGTDILSLLAGIAIRMIGRESDYADLKGYNGEEDMIVALREGRIIVKTSGSPSRGDQVYMGLSSALGTFYSADGASRVALPLANARWVRNGVIEINLPVV